MQIVGYLIRVLQYSDIEEKRSLIVSFRLQKAFFLLYSGSAAGCWFWLSASLTELSFQIAEAGSPSELASRPESQFRQMLDQAGISSVIEPQYLPPLARHDTDSDVTASQTPGRVTYDVTDRSDVTASPTPGRVTYDVTDRSDVTVSPTPGCVTYDITDRSDVTASPTPGRVTYDITDRSDVTASPTPGRVAFDIIDKRDVTATQMPGRVAFDDVTPPNGDGRAKSPPYSGDNVDLIDQNDEGERGYDNEVTHL